MGDGTADILPEKALVKGNGRVKRVHNACRGLFKPTAPQLGAHSLPSSISARTFIGSPNRLMKPSLSLWLYSSWLSPKVAMRSE